MPKGDSNCPHCGARVTPWDVAKAAVLSLLGTTDHTRKNLLCVACNRVVGEGADVCPHCGAKQTSSARLARQLFGNIPSQRRATPVLLGVMVMLFVLQGLMSFQRPDFNLFSFLMGGDRLTSALLGGLLGPFIDYGNQWWRLINSNFLHFGGIHLFFNLSALRVLGPMVEDEYGTGWYLFAFLLTGISGFYASYLISPLAFTVGASASLFGLIGVGIGFAYRERDRRQQQLKTLVQWAVLGVGIGFLNIIPMNNAAHIGGLVSGLAFGLVLSPRNASRRGFRRNLGTLLGYLSVGLSFLGFVLAILGRDETQRLLFG